MNSCLIVAIQLTSLCKEIGENFCRCEIGGHGEVVYDNSNTSLQSISER